VLAAASPVGRRAAPRRAASLAGRRVTLSAGREAQRGQAGPVPSLAGREGAAPRSTDRGGSMGPRRAGRGPAAASRCIGREGGGTEAPRQGRRDDTGVTCGSIVVGRALGMGGDGLRDGDGGWDR